jgi:hypothetical protein
VPEQPVGPRGGRRQHARQFSTANGYGFPAYYLRVW